MTEMTDPIRDAAKAMLDAHYHDGDVGAAAARLLSALSAPQPAADERVKEHMRLAEDANVTEAMITAYLEANDAYWIATDEIPRPPGKWRTGTPREATRAGLIAALSAIQKGAP